ncbi:MAG: serine/threonine-protein kinase [Planctomycetaceae bacterium]
MSTTDEIPVEDPQLLNLVEDLTDALTDGDDSLVSQLLAIHPQYEDRLRELLPCLRAMTGLPNLEIRTTDLARNCSSNPDGVERLAAYTTLGDFLLLRELGRGGMGIVYEAEQVSLARRVALKVLPFGSLSDQMRLRRFRNEAYAAAQLSHPNIVDVYGIGSHDDRHFIAMRFVDGANLARVLRTDLPDRTSECRGTQPHGTTPLPAQLAEFRQAPQPRQTWFGRRSHAVMNPAARLNRVPEKDSASVSGDEAPGPLRPPGDFNQRQIWVALIGTRVAAALEHAHSQGVIHRDIKPSNLIVDTDGKVWVTDFGLARVESDPALTASGHLLGTLRYMSPEQVRGNRLGVDHRADIYSLGATLYEMLADEPMLSAVEQPELLQQLLHEEPVPLRQRQPLVSRDLETIVMKAVSFDAADRYQTAAELEVDLSAFLEHRPIQARPPTTADRFLKWCRRHRRRLVIGGLAAAIMFVVVSVVAFVAWHERSQRIVEQYLRQQQQAVIDRQRDATRNHRYVASLQLAWQSWQGTDGTGMRRRLLDCVPAEAETDLRDFAWHYLWRILEETPEPFGKHTGEAFHITQSPDGKLLATSGSDGVRLWDTTTWQPVRHLSEHTSDVNFSEFTPDGTRTLSASDDGTVKIRDTQTWEVLDSVQCGWWVVAAHLLPDHRRLVVAERRETRNGRESRVRAFDLKTRKMLWQASQRGYIQAMIAVPGSSHVAGVNDGGWFFVLDADTVGDPAIISRRNPGGMVSSVAVDVAGRFVAAGIGQDILVWPLNSKRHTPLLSLPGPHNSSIESLSFTPTGELISADRGGWAVIWNVDWDSEPPALISSRRFKYHVPLWCARVTQDERWLVTSDRHGQIVRWPTKELSPSEPRRIHLADVDRLSLHDKLLVATCSWRDAISSNGRIGWLLQSGSRLQTWDLQEDRPIDTTLLADIGESYREVVGVYVSPDGRRVGAAIDHHLRFFDHATGRWDSGDLFNGRTGWHMAWAPDNRRVAAGSTDGVTYSVEIVDIVTGQRQVLPHRYGGVPQAWSADGAFLATSNSDGTVSLWDTSTWSEVDRFVASPDAGVSLAISPDGRTLATCDGSSVTLWNFATRRPCFSLPVRRLNHGLLRFSPDGRHLGLEGVHEGKRQLLVWTLDSTSSSVGQFLRN